MTGAHIISLCVKQYFQLLISKSELAKKAQHSSKDSIEAKLKS